MHYQRLKSSKIPVHLYQWPLLPLQKQSEFQTMSHFLDVSALHHLNRCVVLANKGELVGGHKLEQLATCGCNHFPFAAVNFREKWRGVVFPHRSSNSLCLFGRDTATSGLPEFCTEVSEGEVEWVRGRGGGPSGRLDPHHSPAFRLRLHGRQIAADFLHAVTQLLEDKRIWEYKKKKKKQRQVKEESYHHFCFAASIVCWGNETVMSLSGFQSKMKQYFEQLRLPFTAGWMSVVTRAALSPSESTLRSIFCDQHAKYKSALQWNSPGPRGNICLY